jgi:hypothetical protein
MEVVSRSDRFTLDESVPGMYYVTREGRGRIGVASVGETFCPCWELNRDPLPTPQSQTHSDEATCRKCGQDKFSCHAHCQARNSGCPLCTVRPDRRHQGLPRASRVQYLHCSPACRGPGPPGCGSLESETVKCGRESRGTRIWEWLRWRDPAAIVNDRPILSNRKRSVGK